MCVNTILYTEKKNNTTVGILAPKNKGVFRINTVHNRDLSCTFCRIISKYDREKNHEVVHTFQNAHSHLDYVRIVIFQVRIISIVSRSRGRVHEFSYMSQSDFLPRIFFSKNIINFSLCFAAYVSQRIHNSCIKKEQSLSKLLLRVSEQRVAVIRALVLFVRNTFLFLLISRRHFF